MKAPSARLEHATYCSASKRSNPLSYEGIWQGWILMQIQRLVKCDNCESAFFQFALDTILFSADNTSQHIKAVTEESTSAEAAREAGSIG
jgi:hypothetical protein